MAHRDPETGKFVSAEVESFEDYEVVSFVAGAGIKAANMSGGTTFGGGDQDTFEGLPLIDYDEIVDRNESLHLIQAFHRGQAYVNSTETADGTVTTTVEVSSSPSRSGAASVPTGDDPIESPVVGGALNEDSIDIIGRPLAMTGHAPFSDSATGVGGGGSAGEDSYSMSGFPDVLGQFHPRDELFLNGVINGWNIDDAGVHVQVTGQHVYGVVEG